MGPARALRSGAERDLGRRPRQDRRGFARRDAADWRGRWLQPPDVDPLRRQLEKVRPCPVRLGRGRERASRHARQLAAAPTRRRRPSRAPRPPTHRCRKNECAVRARPRQAARATLRAELAAAPPRPASDEAPPALLVEERRDCEPSGERRGWLQVRHGSDAGARREGAPARSPDRRARAATRRSDSARRRRTPVRRGRRPRRRRRVTRRTPPALDVPEEEVQPQDALGVRNAAEKRTRRPSGIHRGSAAERPFSRGSFHFGARRGGTSGLSATSLESSRSFAAALRRRPACARRGPRRRARPRPRPARAARGASCRPARPAARTSRRAAAATPRPRRGRPPSAASPPRSPAPSAPRGSGRRDPPARGRRPRGSRREVAAAARRHPLPELRTRLPSPSRASSHSRYARSDEIRHRAAEPASRRRERAVGRQLAFDREAAQHHRAVARVRADPIRSARLRRPSRIPRSPSAARGARPGRSAASAFEQDPRGCGAASGGRCAPSRASRADPSSRGSRRSTTRRRAATPRGRCTGRSRNGNAIPLASASGSPDRPRSCAAACSRRGGHLGVDRLERARRSLGPGLERRRDSGRGSARSRSCAIGARRLGRERRRREAESGCKQEAPCHRREASRFATR